MKLINEIMSIVVGVCVVGLCAFGLGAFVGLVVLGFRVVAR